MTKVDEKVIEMIYKTEAGEYVVSTDGVWLPGYFDTMRAARFAFKLTDEQLSELNNRVNCEEKRAITWFDIKKVRDND